MPDEIIKVPKPAKEAEEKPAKLAKMIDVKIISKNQGAALVEYYEKATGSHRVTVPLEAVQAGRVTVDDLEAGAPYGINWDNVKLKVPTSADLARALHDERIWTKQDLAQRRPEVLTTINRVAGLILSDLLPQITKEL